MANRRHNPRLAKTHHCFTIRETAVLYGVHVNTVRQWLANGLQPIEPKRPILIHGAALNRFHAERRAARRKKCGPGELYCLVCQHPRRPAGDMADFTPITALVGTVTGICPVCDRFISQRVNARRLARFEAEMEVGRRPRPEPITDSSDPSLNCDFGDERTAP